MTLPYKINSSSLNLLADSSILCDVLLEMCFYADIYSSISRLQFSDLILYKKCKDIIQALETFLLD